MISQEKALETPTVPIEASGFSIYGIVSALFLEKDSGRKRTAVNYRPTNMRGSMPTSWDRMSGSSMDSGRWHRPGNGWPKRTRSFTSTCRCCCIAGIRPTACRRKADDVCLWISSPVFFDQLVRRIATLWRSGRLRGSRVEGLISKSVISRREAAYKWRCDRRARSGIAQGPGARNVILALLPDRSWSGQKRDYCEWIASALPPMKGAAIVALRVQAPLPLDDGYIALKEDPRSTAALPSSRPLPSSSCWPRPCPTGSTLS